MERNRIKGLIKSYLDKSILGLEIESPKIDFKRIWYDLKDEKGKNEFIKDVTAIVNTFGLDGFIIIGFDEKKKSFHPTTFKDSKLLDTSEIPNLISSKCSDLFDVNTYDFLINNNRISVIHLPPTLIKPIVILEYKTFKKDGNIQPHRNKIFVRKNSRTMEAAKYDLELMYYDRKNIIPDYEIKTFINNISFDFITNQKGFYVNLTLENTGRKPIAIYDIQVTISMTKGEKASFNKPIRFDENDLQSTLKNTNFIVRANDILNKLIKFHLNHDVDKLRDYRGDTFDLFTTSENIVEIDLIYHLSNGKILQSSINYKGSSTN